MDIDDTPTTGPHRWFRLTRCHTPTDRRNQGLFMVWSLAWALAYVAATWVSQGSALGAVTPWLVAALPAVLSVAALVAYLRFVQQADELVRRIQLEGLAVGFGAGTLLVVGYPLFAAAGAPPLDITVAPAVMVLAWTAGQVIASARYR